MLVGEGDDLVGVLHRVLGARHPRRPGALGDLAGGDLVTEVADRLRRRADPGQTRFGHRGREIGILRQKPITRVYGVSAGSGGHVDQLVDAQVRVGRGLPAQGVGLVGQPGGQLVPVRIGIDGHGCQSGVPAGTDDPYGDFAPVRDQHLQHAGQCSERSARGAVWSEERVSSEASATREDGA